MKIKPKMQEITSGKNQDCLRACVASLLNLRVRDVPNFVEVEDESWWEKMQQFIHKHGYNLVLIQLIIPGENQKQPQWFPVVEIPAIFFGTRGLFEGEDKETTENLSHAVVGICTGKSVEIIHDPHPLRPWLTQITAVAVMVPIYEK